MKVLDLQCAHQHVFEGWFGSEDDFQSQLSRAMVQCPMCGDAAITKRLSAPRLNLGAAYTGPREGAGAQAQDSRGQSAQAGQTAQASQTTQPTPTPQAAHDLVAGPQLPQALMAAWMDMAKRVLANTADVGDKFAEEARKIHYGETEERGIRGRATRDETEALLEEGIAVMPFMLPEVLKGPVQ
jgi:hypothetical protein